MSQATKVVVVTGGSKGIGNGIAKILAERDYQVVLTSRDADRAEKAAASLANATHPVLGVVMDLSDRATLHSAVETILKKFGRVDGLINNAVSQTIGAPLLEAPEDIIELSITANITNTLILTRLLHPTLKENKGNIVNISSAITGRYLSGLPLYAMYKSAINQVTKALAAEWAPDIRVNCVMPGFVRSEAFKDLGMPSELIEEKYQFYQNYIPMGKIGEPEDIGRLVAYMISDDAKMLTGSIISLDGGFACQSTPT